MFAAPVDRFRLSCVVVAGTFAAFFIAPVAFNFPSSACLCGLAASWLACSAWTLNSYSQQPGQRLWKQGLRFFWLSICMVLSIELSVFVAGFFTDSRISMVHSVWRLYSPDFGTFIEGCT